MLVKKKQAETLRISEFQRKDYSIIYEAVNARYYHLQVGKV